MSGEAEAARGEGPDTDEDEDASSVRPSAPTLQHASDSSSLPQAQRPIVIRSSPPAAGGVTPTPVTPGSGAGSGPASGIDRVVTDLSTTTETGRDPVPPEARPLTTPTPGGSATFKTSGPTSSPRGLIGAQLGRYEIVEELGHGGMATVYRARDPRLGRDVALKVIHRHLRDNTEIAQRFRHEARAVAKLKHPSIVEIYDVPDEAEEGERFLVAELVEGPSLRKYLQMAKAARGSSTVDAAGGPAAAIPAELAAALVLQVLSALERAHQEGIIHRDVKPENILIAGLTGPTSQRASDPSRTPPVAKLTDFGIAKILDAQGMTSTGQILGSPAHMAPEQIEGGDIGPRVDIFATGVLFYELATGTLPFDGKNPAQVIRRVLEGEFTPADRAAPMVGGRWSAIIASMLAREPEKRPASAEIVAHSIRAELETLGITDPNKELLDYLRDPATVGPGWGQRLKPRLLERAAAAREAGDVIGAANDLNRALAYDPLDPKLVRAVTTLRSRERRLRTLRRAVPLIFVAGLVTSGTFTAVRWYRNRPATNPSNGAIVTGPVASPSPSTPSSPSAKASASTKVDAGPVTSTTTPTVVSTLVPITVSDGGPRVGTTRLVHFNVFPAAATYSIDGSSTKIPAIAADQTLTVGEHTVSAEGVSNCCEAIVGRKIKVEAGDGPQNVALQLKFNPARIFVQGLPEGVTATVTVKSAAGVTLQSGPSPLTIPMTDTEMQVTIVMEAIGFSKKQMPATLRPGDPKFYDLTPE